MVSPRIHGNSKRLPANTLPQAVVADMNNFIENFAEENAIVLPGTIPGNKDEDIKLVPSQGTKAAVWRKMETIC